MTQVTPAADPADPEEIQRRIQQYRERLLDGRGPGASPEETAPQMRNRQWLGGVPAATARQHEADQATLADGDPPAVEDVIIRQRAELSATLTVLTARLHALRTRAATSLRRSLIAAAVGAATALAAQAKLRRLNRQTPRSSQLTARGASNHRMIIHGDLAGIGRPAGDVRPRIVTGRLRPVFQAGECRRRR